MVSLASHDDRLPISTIEQMLTDFWSVNCFKNQDGNTNRDAIKQLDGYDDHNYRIQSQNNQLFILKITNQEESTRTSLIETQNQMMLHFDARIPDKSVPVPVEVWGRISDEIIYSLENPCLTTNFVFEPKPPKKNLYPLTPYSGQFCNTRKLPYRVMRWNRHYVRLDFGDNDVRVVRLFYYVKGVPMGATKVFTTEYSNRFFIELGCFLARIVQEAKKLPIQPFLQVSSLWKLENAVLLPKILCSNPDILDQYSYISYNIIMWVCKEFNENVLTNLHTHLERQVIHGDLNEDNILVERKVRPPDEIRYLTYPIDFGEPHSVDYFVTGLIDFADAHISCALFELAIALTYILINSENFNALSAVLFGYRMHKLFPNIELEVLKICIEARLCQTIILSLLKLKQMGVTASKIETTTDPIVNYIAGKNKLKWHLLTRLRNMTNQQFLYEIAQKSSQMAAMEPPLDTTCFLNIQTPECLQRSVRNRIGDPIVSPSVFTYRTHSVSADLTISRSPNVYIYLPNRSERKRELESKFKLPEPSTFLESFCDRSSASQSPKTAQLLIEKEDSKAELEKELVSSSAQKIVKSILKFMYPEKDVFQEEILPKPTFNYTAPMIENPPKWLPTAYKNKGYSYNKTSTTPKLDRNSHRLNGSFYTRVPPPARRVRIQINFDQLKKPKTATVETETTTKLELPRCETPIITVKNFEDNSAVKAHLQSVKKDENDSESISETVKQFVSAFKESSAVPAIDQSINVIGSVNGFGTCASLSSIPASHSASFLNGSYYSDALENAQTQSCLDKEAYSISAAVDSLSLSDTASTKPLEQLQSISAVPYGPTTTPTTPKATADRQPSSTLVKTPESPRKETPFESPLSASSTQITSPIKTVMVKMSLQRDLFINTEELKIALESCSTSSKTQVQETSVEEETSVNNSSTTVTSAATDQAPFSAQSIPTCAAPTVVPDTLISSSDVSCAASSHTVSSLKKTTAHSKPLTCASKENPHSVHKSSVSKSSEKSSTRSNKSNIPKKLSSFSLHSCSKTVPISRPNFKYTSPSSFEKQAPFTSSPVSGSKQSASPVSKMPTCSKTETPSKISLKNKSPSTPALVSSSTQEASLSSRLRIGAIKSTTPSPSSKTSKITPRSDEKSNKAPYTKPFMTKTSSKTSQVLEKSHSCSAAVDKKSSLDQTRTGKLPSVLQDENLTSLTAPIQVPSTGHSSVTSSLSTEKKQLSKSRRRPRKK